MTSKERDPQTRGDRIGHIDNRGQAGCSLRAPVGHTSARIAIPPVCSGHIAEWHVDLAFFLILGKLGSYLVSPR